MNIYTAEQTRSLEQRAVQCGISPLVLMENAACNIARIIECEGRFTDPFVIICGTGNNGGDGLALARHLANAGRKVEVLLLADGRHTTPEARTNRSIVKRMGIPIREIARVDRRLRQTLEQAGCIVDAIIGSGLGRALEGMKREVVQAVNASARPVVALDMPTGIHADTGAVMGDAIAATMTIALGTVKPGHLVFPGRGMTGVLRFAPVSIPASYYDEPTEYTWLDAAYGATVLPKRRKDTHKGDYGRLYVLGGSPGLTGAPCLAAQAALRAGAGLVTVACSASLNAVFEAKLTEVMTLPLPDDGGYLAPKALTVLAGALDRADAIVAGPGLSTHASADELFDGLFRRLELPAVIDADGIALLARHKDMLASRTSPLVITPHAGEMSRFTGQPVDEVLADPVAVARATAKEHGIFVVLKGATTVVASPSGRIAFSTAGNPGMATGGTGDVLAGVIGGLLAQGIDTEDAVRLGVSLHSASGDRAASRRGQTALIASDIVDDLADVLKSWEEAQ